MLFQYYINQFPSTKTTKFFFQKKHLNYFKLHMIKSLKNKNKNIDGII
jgi:hypothetical protein